MVDLEIPNLFQVSNTLFFLISISLYNNLFWKNVSFCPYLLFLIVDNSSSSKLVNGWSLIYTRIINTIFVYINMIFAEFWQNSGIDINIEPSSYISFRCMLWSWLMFNFLCLFSNKSGCFLHFHMCYAFCSYCGSFLSSSPTFSSCSDSFISRSSPEFVK